MNIALFIPIVPDVIYNGEILHIIHDADVGISAKNTLTASETSLEDTFL